MLKDRLTIHTSDIHTSLYVMERVALSMTGLEADMTRASLEDSVKAKKGIEGVSKGLDKKVNT